VPITVRPTRFRRYLCPVFAVGPQIAVSRMAATPAIQWKQFAGFPDIIPKSCPPTFSLDGRRINESALKEREGTHHDTDSQQFGE